MQIFYRPQNNDLIYLVSLHILQLQMTHLMQGIQIGVDIGLCATLLSLRKWTVVDVSSLFFGSVHEQVHMYMHNVVFLAVRLTPV